MILKRCEYGHYYDGEIYKQCPDCTGIGRNTQMDLSGMSYAYRNDGDYADEDTVTVALPRAHGQQPRVNVSADEEPVTVAMPRQPAPAAKPVRKPTFKPVVGWLVCMQGKDFGSSFTIKLGKNFIGRSPAMDIVLQGDESIAEEKHAAIYYVPKQRRFAAEPGTTGKRLYINRNAVMRPVWIKQHDILTIGNSSLMFFPCCGEHFSWEELIRRHREKGWQS